MNNHKPIIIFRYHDHLDVVRQRVAWAKKLNPGVPVYGMYGGDGEVEEETASVFASNYKLTLDKEKAWMSLDLAVLEWYRAAGKDVDFTHAYVVEWDLVYTKPLHEVMPVPELGQSLLTSYIPLARVEYRWNWTNGSQPKQLKEWLDLKRAVAMRLGFMGPYYACQGPGCVLSKEFFEAYDGLELPTLCHDELRIPLVHGIAALRVGDTNLYPPDWNEFNDPDVEALFNCNKQEVTPDTLYEAVKEGHSAFHPVYQLLDEEHL